MIPFQEKFAVNLLSGHLKPNRLREASYRVGDNFLRFLIMNNWLLFVRSTTFERYQFLKFGSYFK